jgi:hypothetical protein
MANLDLAQSRQLLVRVIEEGYAHRHSPLPGAYVKAQLLSRALDQEATFNERELGFRSFLDFVKSVPEVGIQGRSGSDVLLAPITASDVLSAFASPLPRLRRDFWRAFIEFPVPNTVRLYDPNEDKILHEDAGTARPGIVIEPVPRETQLQWRRTFSEEQPDSLKAILLAALEGTGTAAFNEFARRLRENPSVMRAWNRFVQKLITDHVSAWAAANNVAEDCWSAGKQTSYSGGGGTGGAAPKVQNISQRAELYNLFDSLPIEDLLQLRVPLGLVLKVIRDKG